MQQQPLKLAVVVGSVRDGRFAPAVADWFAVRARTRDDFETDVIDPADHCLPLSMPSALPPEAAASKDGLSARLAAADAFVVVTPEYNHSFPAALKNFLDWFQAEWAAKPVGFVSYGGMAGGLRAVEHLRQVFAELHAVTVRDGVSLHNPWQEFADHGGPGDPATAEGAAKTMLDQLAWWGAALRQARRQHPYSR